MTNAITRVPGATKETYQQVKEAIKGAIAFDLGTKYSSVYVLGKGLVLTRTPPVGLAEIPDEYYVIPSVVKMDGEGEDSRCLAAGDEAFEQIGRTIGAQSSLVWPIEKGCCTNEFAAAHLMRYLKGMADRGFRKPLVVIGVPHVANQTHRKALRIAGEKVGGKVHIVSEAVAAAFGARDGSNQEETEGPAKDQKKEEKALARMSADWGDGSVDIAVIQKETHELASRPASFQFGGRMLNNIIIRHVREDLGLVIGQVTAEQIKCGLLQVGEGEKGDKAPETSLLIRGKLRDSETTSKPILITGATVNPWFEETWEQIEESFREYIYGLDAQIHADLQQPGNFIAMSGGGCLVPGLCKRLTSSIGFTFKTVKRPLVTVGLGLGLMLTSERHLRIGEEAISLHTALTEKYYGNGRSKPRPDVQST